MSHSLHALHRARFLDLLAARDAVAIIPTATTKTRNDDADYKFRPTSDFWYLTGLNEPGACLVLLPGKDGEEPRSVLFLRERDKLREIWDGRRLGLERAPGTLGVDAAMDIEELWTELPGLLEGRERIMWRFGDDDVADRRMIETFTSLRDREIGRAHVRTPVPSLSRMPSSA